MRRKMPPRLKSNIATLRKAKKLNQTQLAEGVHVRTSVISYYENNQVYPDPERIVSLCDVLGCEYGDLYEVCKDEK